MMNTIIGKRVVRLRRRDKLSQGDLARLLNASQNAICLLEKGKTKAPHIDRLVLIAGLFDCSLDYLVGRSDDDSRQSARTTGRGGPPRGEPALYKPSYY